MLNPSRMLWKKKAPLGLFQLGVGLYGAKSYIEKTMINQQQNECGGILAYISNSKNEDGTKMAEGRNGVSFVKTYSDYLRKNPYY